MIELKVKRLFPTEDARPQLPTRGSEDAACFDFYASRIEEKDEYNGGDDVRIHLDIAVEIPKGYVLTLQPRSSFTEKGWFMPNSPAQIDADYRGAIQIRMSPNWFWNSDEEKTDGLPFPYKVGDRCVQGRLEKLVPTEVVEIQEFTEETSRGTGGFGSTGK